MKNVITPREVNIFSNDGRYNIVARMKAEQDGYSREMGATYKGSFWTCSIYENGKRIDGIQVKDGNYQPYISVYAMTSHNMTLNKNLVLFMAFSTRMFSDALKDIDEKKVEKQYYKEYVDARIADGSLD